MKYRILCIILIVAILLSLTGCNNKDILSSQQRFKADHKTLNPDSFIASENDNYALKWDSEKKRVVFYDKQRGIPWSYLPFQENEVRYDEDGYEIISHPQISSPISITYINKEENVVDSAIGHNECIKSNDFFVEKINDGIRITYFFSKSEISITVDYTLSDDNLKISIDPLKIQENKCWLIDINIAPFFCSIPNGAEDSYLFVPSGSGALVYSDHTSDDLTVYTDETYGRDFFAPEDGMLKTETASVKLPVFGAKNGNNAVFAIIEKGAESTSICSNVGNNNLRYSSVYSIYHVRRYESMITNNGRQTMDVYAEDCCSQPLSIAYYPLHDEEADYVGMARIYRNYLDDTFGFDSTENQRMLNLQILGGKKITSAFLGVPYSKVFATTTISEAEKIIKELYEKTGVAPAAELLGFGKSGLDIGEIGGGFDVGTMFGNKKQLSDLSRYCKENKIALFMNFDSVQFKKSSKLASIKYDSAKTTNKRNATLYYYRLWSGTRDNSGVGLNEKTSFFLLKRSLLDSVMDKICGFSNAAGLNGIGLDTLSSIAYSDYSDRKYYSKGGISKQVENLLDVAHSKGFKVAGNASNAYFAVNSDYIFDSPSRSSKYDSYAEDVPFYQIVFKGKTPIASEPVNITADCEKSILSAVETGIGITYVLSHTYNNKIAFSDDHRYFGSVYEGMADGIVNTIKKYNDYYESISDSTIKAHEIISENVRKTVFDNGVTVYVNYGQEAIQTDLGMVEAMSFVYGTGGVANG